MKMLFVCGALAAGEFIASRVSWYADTWLALIVVAVLVALLGYGLQVRGWHLLAVFVLGVALFFRASIESEHEYRLQPWMRGREKKVTYRQMRMMDPRTRMIFEDLSRRVAIGLDHDRETAALNRAILLGDRKGMPKEIRRIFVDSGTIHLFAISGLHVMSFAGVISIMLRLMGLSFRIAGLVAVPILWGYVHVIGWPPSAVRAAMMVTLCRLAPSGWRKFDSLRAWEITFLAVHLWNPLMIANVGNVLSFVVMLSLVLFSAMTQGESGWRQELRMTCAAWAAGVPISACVFGTFTPGGILANLMLLGSVKIAVVSGVAGVMASLVSETLASHLNNLCALLVRFMVMIAKIVSCLPGASVFVPRWSPMMCVGWYAALFLWLYLIRLRRNRSWL